jgi:hypothetical protein
MVPLSIISLVSATRHTIRSQPLTAVSLSSRFSRTSCRYSHCRVKSAERQMERCEVRSDKPEPRGKCREQASDAILPAPWITGSVKDGNYGDYVLLHEKEHLVRESPG